MTHGRENGFLLRAWVLAFADNLPASWGLLRSNGSFFTLTLVMGV